MIMRMFFFILAMSLVVSPVSASETTRQGLKALYDEYHYSLTVEWDQKDKAFAKAVDEKFKTGLEELQKQGLTNEELIEFASTQFKDKKTQADFDNLMMLTKLNLLKPLEVNKMVNDLIRKSYQQGANWNADVAIKIIGGVAGALFLALITWIIVDCAKNPKKCEGSGGSSVNDDNDDWSDDWCTETYVCDYYYDEDGEWSDCYYECW